MADLGPWKMQSDTVRKQNAPTSLRAVWVSPVKFQLTGLASVSGNPLESFLSTPHDQSKSSALGQGFAFRYLSWATLMN